MIYSSYQNPIIINKVMGAVTKECICSLNEFAFCAVNEPLIALLSVATATVVLFIFITMVFGSDPIWIARLDLVWILTGFLGVLSLVAQNKVNLLHNKITIIDHSVQRTTSSLSSTLKGGRHCAPDRVLRLINKEDSISSELYCIWVNKLAMELRQIDSASAHTLVIPEIPDTSKRHLYRYEDLVDRANEIKKLGDTKQRLLSEKNIPLSFLNETVGGGLLLIFAFALRFAIALVRIRELKPTTTSKCQVKNEKSKLRGSESSDKTS